MKWFQRVSIAKSEKENSQNSQISLFGFQFVAVNIDCQLKIYTSYLVYSQVWLNLPMDGHHFLNILRWLQVRLQFFFKNQMQCEDWHESRHVRKGVEDEWKSF
jgi:hypothetical protein